MRLGFVGTGFISYAHGVGLRCLEKAGLTEQLELVHFDPDPSKSKSFADLCDSRALGSTKEVVSECDALYVCTPTAYHAEAVALACEASRPVFCEKPLARTLEEAVDLASSALRAGVPFQVGLVLRFSYVTRWLERLLQSERSDRPGRLMAGYLRDDQFFPIQGHYGSTWRADKEVAGAGTLLEHSIHDLDLLAHVLGPVESVEASTRNLAGHEGVEDVAVAVLTHESGAPVAVVSAWHQVLSRPSTRRLELIFEHAVVWCDDEHAGPVFFQDFDGVKKIDVVDEDEVARLGLSLEPASVALASYALEDLSFVRAAKGEAQVTVGAEAALYAHVLAESCYRSAREGRRLGVEDTLAEVLAGVPSMSAYLASLAQRG